MAATSAAADEKPASAGHADHAPTEKGPQGGVLTRAGGNGVELLVSESSGSSRLRLWAYAGSKPVAAGEIKARVRLLRPNGAENCALNRPTARWSAPRTSRTALLRDRSRGELARPGRAAEGVAGKDEGLIPLTAEQVAAAGIRSAAAAPAALEATSQFPGEIKFNADRTAHIVPRLAGVAQEAPVELGQMVKKGELLAALSSTALSDLRSEWLAAVKRRDLAAATHQRELKLWREQVTAEQDYQQARTALQEAQIAVQNAEQKLAAVGATPRAKDLSRLEIRAPFDGVIVEKHITLGEALADNVNIFTLSGPGHGLGGILDRRQGSAGRARGRGRPRQLGGVYGSAMGKVSYIGSLLGQQTRTATARVTLENPDMAWRPGLFVSVNVVTSQRDVPVAIAADAVQTVEDQPSVFIEVPGGFLAQPVKLGKAAGDQVEVLSGLAPGVRYVTDNAFVLKSELGKASADHALRQGLNTCLNA